tara:strand:+ start:514 stop:678 length:165 start_codon:yes stop_codon:yes gene_type:complete
MSKFDNFELVLGLGLTVLGFNRLASNQQDGVGITFAIAGINSIIDAGKAIYGGE